MKLWAPTDEGSKFSAHEPLLDVDQKAVVKGVMNDVSEMGICAFLFIINLLRRHGNQCRAITNKAVIPSPGKLGVSKCL
jgi:hypothetical protein